MYYNFDLYRDITDQFFVYMPYSIPSMNIITYNFNSNVVE